MTNECLVHLIRHLHRQHETSILGSLSQILFDRCVGALRGYTRGFDQDTARDFYHDVYVELIDVLLDLAKPRADFLEVRFAMALRRRAIEVRMKYSTYWKRIALDADPAEILDASVVWIPDEDNAGTSEAMRRVTNNRLLKNIPEPQKSAFILHHMYGFTHKELAAPFKRSVSAIRNWLRRVDELLANDKE
jgi:DNA-directed RNA polymerase specialized sigma24 family protein